MKLRADSSSIQSLCNEYARGFTIPDFQRNYSWTSVQIEQFWNDIKGLAENRYTDHFIGPMVILQSDSRSPVVDGQQRLTTLLVLSALIRDKLVNEYEDPQLSIDGTREFISQKLIPLLFLADKRTPYIDGNYQIRSIINNYLIKHPDSSDRWTFENDLDRLSLKERRNAKVLINATKQLKVLLDNWVNEVSPLRESRINAINNLITAILDRLQILTIEVGSEEDAFAIFETLNERGLKLSPADLLRSYILRRVVEDNPSIDRDTINNSWDQIADYLDDTDVTSFLRHYLLTYNEGSVQKKDIFRKIRDEIDPSNHSQGKAANRKLEEIKYAASCYAKLVGNPLAPIENSNLDILFKKLNMIGDSYKVFLLAAQLKGFDETNLMVAARNVEVLLFRWIVCGKNAQILENIFQSAALNLIPGDGPSFQNQLRFLIDNAPSDDEFRNSLLSNTYRDTKLQAYALRSICFGITGSEVTTDRYEVSVEHIAPQSPEGDYWYLKVAPKEPPAGSSSETFKSYEDFVYSWGNITILEKRLNSSVRNGNWDVKKNGQGRHKGYKDSSIASTSDLIDISEWTHSTIEERTRWFTNQAVNYWSRALQDLRFPRLERFQSQV